MAKDKRYCLICNGEVNPLDALGTTLDAGKSFHATCMPIRVVDQPAPVGERLKRRTPEERRAYMDGYAAAMKAVKDFAGSLADAASGD